MILAASSSPPIPILLLPTLINLHPLAPKQTAKQIIVCYPCLYEYSLCMIPIPYNVGGIECVAEGILDL